jgi:hypothetical protein
MNKEAVVVVLDCNHTMNKEFASSTQKKGEAKTRFQIGMESVEMLLQ